MAIRPRGIRNNNPGNIRYDGTRWRGLRGDDGAYCVFDTPENGIRAMAKILKTYQRKGFVTIRQIINRWAPTSENNTDAYINSVSSRLGIGPDVELSVKNWPGLITAIIFHENGQQPYSVDQVLAGIAAA